MDELMSRAKEGSSFSITLNFTDESGTAIEKPLSLSWTLVDINGNIMNSSGAEVTIAGGDLANPQIITLSGTDLSIPDKSTKERILLVKGTYTSSIGEGAALPIRESVKFFIEDFFEPPEMWEPVIITLSEVRSLLQIQSSDNSKDENIKVLIPIIQDFIIEYCNNDFEVKGVSLPPKKTIHFENDDVNTPEIVDDNMRFIDEGFEAALDLHSRTGTHIAFLDKGDEADEITDSGNKFITLGFKKGMRFAVLGSESNDGVYTALSIAAGIITVATGSFTGELAGESVTINYGIEIRVEDSRRNDGLFKVKKITGGKLYLFDDEILIDEKRGEVITISIVTGTVFPAGIKIAVSKLIGYQLSQKDIGIRQEKLGDYSVTFNIDYPNSLLEDLHPYKLSTISLSTTSDRLADEEIITIETELS